MSRRTSGSRRAATKASSSRAPFSSIVVGDEVRPDGGEDVGDLALEPVLVEELVELAVGAQLDGGQQQLGLAGEAAVDGAGGVAGPAGDLGDAGAVVALLGEHLGGGLDQLLADRVVGRIGGGGRGRAGGLGHPGQDNDRYPLSSLSAGLLAGRPRPGGPGRRPRRPSRWRPGPPRCRAGRSSTRPATSSPAPALRHDDVPVGAGLPRQHPAGQVGVGGGVAAHEVLPVDPAQARASSGSTSQVVTVPSRSSTTVDGPVVVSSSRPSPPWTISARSAPLAVQDAGHALGHAQVGHADEVAPHPAGVGERPEDVERRRDAEVAAGRARRGASPGGTAGRSRSPMPASATQRATPSGPELDGDAERLEQVGGPAGRRGGPVAVLADLAPGAGHDDAPRAWTR